MARALMLAAFGFALGCGSTTTQPSPNGAPSVTASSSGGAAPQAEDPGRARHERIVKAECNQIMDGATAYCDCMWEEMTEAFTVEEMDGAPIDPPRRKAFNVHVHATCGPKLPEETVQRGFRTGCVGDLPELGGYCDCMWTELRKQLPLPVLVDESFATSDAFRAVSGSAVKTCGPSYPEATGKRLFMDGCAKDPKAAKFCQCAWTEVRKIASAAEIGIQLLPADWKPKVDKACGTLRPKQPAAPK